ERILRPEFQGENLRRDVAWMFTYQLAFVGPEGRHFEEVFFHLKPPRWLNGWASWLNRWASCGRGWQPKPLCRFPARLGYWGQGSCRAENPRARSSVLASASS